MIEFNQLKETVERLLSPSGCPWDKVQTLKSMRNSLIEEPSELIDAIDSDDNAHIEEELGDLFFLAIFLSKLADKEGRSKMEDILNGVNQKLIRRHPHVFGDIKIDDYDQLIEKWEEIKQQEKGKTHRKSTLDSIPKGLPALSRAQKVSKKIQKTDFSDLPKADLGPLKFKNEEDLGKVLWSIVAKAQEQDLDAEHALRKVLVSLESAFREYEASKPE